MGKKDKILQAALHLFVKNGIDASSTSKIAKQAGVASGLIFHHFGNKENLVGEVFLKTKSDIAEALKKGFTTKEFSEAEFKKIWLYSINIGLEHIMAIRFLHQYSYSRFISSEGRKKGKLFFEIHRAFYEDGIQKGFLKDLDMDFLTEQIFEQYLFTLIYIDENKPSKAVIENMYTVNKDMIFK